MASRFTQTDKWTKDKWFLELPFKEKGIFQYLCENCDIAGFYELSMKRLRNDLAPLSDDEIKTGLKNIDKSYVLSRDKKIIFIKNFCKHQNNVPLNLNNNAHKGILKLIGDYQPTFAFDIINIIKKSNTTRKNSPLNEGLQSTIGIGYIEFNVFWSLYNYKIGDKAKCEKRWLLLSTKEQEFIISILPKWLKCFGGEGHILPYPETFLNQKRWNDQIPEQSILKAIKGSNGFPDYWSEKFASTLPTSEWSRYWGHLRDMGLVPKKDSQGRVVDWIPKVSNG